MRTLLEQICTFPLFSIILIKIIYKRLRFLELDCYSARHDDYCIYDNALYFPGTTHVTSLTLLLSRILRACECPSALL